MAGFTGASPIVTDGLVFAVDAANYESYPGSGTTWGDLSGNGNNGTLVNGPTFDSGNGGSIVFDGTNDYVNLGNILNMGTSDISICGAFKRTLDNTNIQFIFSKSLAGSGVGRYWIDQNESIVEANGKLRMGIAWLGNHIDYRSIQNININTWYYYTFVIDRDDKLFIYINGVLDTSFNISSYSSINMQTSLPYRIGSYTASDQVSPIYYWGGNIAFHLHYNKALSSAEVLQNYNALKSRFNL
jgi:hypothetical protein